MSSITWLTKVCFLLLIDFKHSFQLHNYCCYCSVAQLCLTLCDPMDCSTPVFAVLHCLPEFAQTHVHWIRDAIQLSPCCLKSLLQHHNSEESTLRHSAFFMVQLSYPYMTTGKTITLQQSWRIHIPNFKIYYKATVIKKSVVLALRQTNKPME